MRKATPRPRNRPRSRVPPPCATGAARRRRRPAPGTIARSARGFPRSARGIERLAQMREEVGDEVGDRLHAPDRARGAVHAEPQLAPRRRSRRRKQPQTGRRVTEVQGRHASPSRPRPGSPWPGVRSPAPRRARHRPAAEPVDVDDRLAHLGAGRDQQVAARAAGEVRNAQAREIGVRGIETELENGNLALQDFQLLELRAGAPRCRLRGGTSSDGALPRGDRSTGGMAGEQRRQPGSQHRRDQPLRSGDAHLAVESRVATRREVFRGQRLRLHRLGVREHALTGGRERPAGAGSPEQPRAQLRLEGGDAAADGRLRDAKDRAAADIV